MFVVLIILHTPCSKMTVTVWPLPCNYCLSVTQFFSKTAHWHIGFMRARVELLKDEHHSACILATKQPGLESSGLQSVVGDARKGLSTFRDTKPKMLTSCMSALSVWDKLNQRVTDMAVRQWQTSVHACIKAKGGYFEHSLLWLTLLINIHMLFYVHLRLYVMFVTNGFLFQ